MTAERAARRSAGTAAAPARPLPARAVRPVMSLRWIVSLAMVALTVVVGGGVGAIAERRARAELTAEIETRLRLEARNLALTSASALLTDYPELTLVPLVRQMQSRQPELAWVVVVDRNGVIHGHSDVRRLGTLYVPPAGLELRSTAGAAQETLQANAGILMASAPILHPGGQVLGEAHVALRRASIERRLAGARRQQFVALAVFLMAGVGAAFLLSARLLRPLGALRAGIERIGAGDLDTRLALDDRTEIGRLAEAVNAMASDLKRAQAQRAERERLAHEMELAQRIQRSLVAPGRTVAGPFVIESAQRPATEVGGDYVDVFELPDGGIGLAIADVSGKGLAGCLVTSMLSALLRAFRTTHLSPAAMLATLDERMRELLPRGSFVTMFYGILEPGAGRLRYASAGHNPPLVYRARQRTATWAPAGGLPLGASRAKVTRVVREELVELEPGDALIQFTDGISEALDRAGREQFGLERMAQRVCAAAPEGAAAIRQALDDAVTAWRGERPPFDDETVLVVCREGTAAGGGVGDDEALSLLDEATRRGRRLRLPASLAALVRIDDWLADCPVLRDLGGLERECLRAALREACANVVEHGQLRDGEDGLELWWLEGDGPAGVTDAGTDAGPAVAPDPAAAVARGHFLLRDQGVPFRPDDWRPTDFHDRRVWRRGRGFGLDLIHRAMERVDYHPGTPAGNLTIMAFGRPGARAGREEIRHAG